MRSTSVPLILVVDDSEASRFVVADVLTKSGFRVSQARSGREALAAIDRSPHDLVVVDVRLPDITGFGLARRLRAKPDHRSTPILFVSASLIEPSAHALGLASGADAYLNHPVDPTLLVATVRSLLRTRQAEDVERLLADVNEAFADSPDPLEEARALAIDNARLFREADAARHEAQVANAAKVDFLAAMSHELRTPLNAIAGFVDLMALGIHGPITPEQQADLARIGQNERHLATLIGDILNYAKLEAGRLEYDMQQVIAGDALAEVHTLARAVFDAKGVGFDYVPGDAGAIVSADPDRLRQVLLNVVGNAAKFTPPGGSVVLTSAADAQSVRLFCKDTGRGIPVERLAAIFEPFVQVDRHLNPSATQGIGLGLSISRDLMRGMDGDLVVESEPGAGSTFTIVLRRSRTTREASSAAAQR